MLVLDSADRLTVPTLLWGPSADVFLKHVNKAF